MGILAMILKKGVTGYTGGDLSFECDGEARVVEFKRCCYSFVQQLNGEVFKWYAPDINLHYVHARIKLDDEELYIFHHDRFFIKTCV